MFGQFASYKVLPCPALVDQSPTLAVSYSLAKGEHDKQVVAVELILDTKKD